MEKTDYWSTKKKIGKWDFNSFDFEELEGDKQHSCNCKLTWPSKYYTCSFCKREFRSAQALGGHMNVHRKDRARLRLLSSWVLECQNPNPNPNPNSSPSNLIPSHSADSSVYPHHSSLLSPLVSTTTPSSSLLAWEDRRKPLIPQLELLSKGETMTPFLGVEKLNMHAQNYELEGGGVTGLDLKRGFQDSKEVLDLELRLG